MSKENENNDISLIEEESEEVGDDEVVLPKAKIILAKKLLKNIKENNERLISLFGGFLSEEDEDRIGLAEIINSAEDGDGSNIVEGVFDGENMIGPDGKEYSVPPNYASKSKLVEGDFLKLTITDRGTFVYKQTKPAERERLMGNLEKDEEGDFIVFGEGGKKWKVLTASITYFKGAVGDKVALLIPKGGGQWGAVENIIKNK
ncbi:MAG: hypothetical protein WC415_05630 [Patescibacteria group bacterium]|jgi:hypothetical protein